MILKPDALEQNKAGAIIKYYEDRLNIDHDTRSIGVQSIIVIEDDIRDCERTGGE